jgi:hypothetical protein
MAILTAKEITNLYLYGSNTTPLNKVDGELIRIKNPSKSTEILTSTRDFMATAGRFAILNKLMKSFNYLLIKRI